MIPRIALTTGDPAGVGPDICIKLAQHHHHCAVVAIGDPDLLLKRAAELKLPLTLREFSGTHSVQQNNSSELYILPCYLKAKAKAGCLNSKNAGYVMATLEEALEGSINHAYHAIVTAPVSKSTLMEGGYKFFGHTEFFAERANIEKVVMMIAGKKMRVALVTTHLPLAKVAKAITREQLMKTIDVLSNGLKRWFGLVTPRILVAGLNPHAGENGHLGCEEEKIIAPVVKYYRLHGMHIDGPLPADSIFSADSLAMADVILTMYHDQGLPVIKSHYARALVNVTLGLPFIRTSVDHGVGLDVAGTQLASEQSLLAAVLLAKQMHQYDINNAA